MNADPVVMEYFPSPQSMRASLRFFKRISDHFDKNGFGLYAVDGFAENAFIGFIGFMVPSFEAHFTPCVEISWRLSKEIWNRGYATEGAGRCLEYGLKTLQLEEVYSFTAKINQRSERIMQKIGMIKTGEFEHPVLPPGDHLRTHVLYRTKQSFQKEEKK